MAAPEYDIIIAGAGFGAVSTLHRLREKYNIKVFEKGADFGGIWYWNCYPGARVDSDQPIYQLFDKELYQGFTFRERYPGWQEIRRYFHYLDEKLQLSKYIDFNCAVVGAKFNEDTRKWHVKTSDGRESVASIFIPAIGFAAKKYVPAYPGIENFKGEIHHTAEWPQQGIELKGKKIAIIGTGASGVQTIQECGEDAKHLTVYQRTPNFACPMNQYQLNDAEVSKMKTDGELEEAFKACHNTFAGFQYDFQEKNTFDDSAEERKKFFEDLLVKQGGFRFWLNTYKDMLFDEAANREAYNFWRDFTRSRIKDPRKQEILAPMEPPHPWGTKRPSLEQYYYEIYNLPHVDIINVSDDPITEITATGIKTKSGEGDRDVDVIALATGFDSVTGSLAQLDIRGTSGETIAEHWADGLKTAIGIAIHGFPNMFYLYGPQAPTAFSNGPSCVQIQADWLVTMLDKVKKEGVTRIEAKKETEDDWAEQTATFWNKTLFPQAKSWYNGSNVPGKRVEPLNFAGGIPTYIKALDDSLDNGFQGWNVSK